MDKPKKSPKNQETSLADRLRMEAAGSRPDFSESLHRTIAEAIARRQSENAAAIRSTPAAEKPRRTFWANRRAWTVATAAACVLAVVAVVGERNGDLGQRVEPPQRIVAEPALADLPPPDVWTEYAWNEVRQLAASASPMPSSDHLGDDARLAADVVLRRLPIDADWHDPETP
jgi:negative regulator of sigma E activity